jgi:hypothetical protein
MKAPKAFAVADYLARQFAEIDTMELESRPISITK